MAEQATAKKKEAVAYFISVGGDFEFRFAACGCNTGGLKDGKVCCCTSKSLKVTGDRLVAQCRRYCERGKLEEVDDKWTMPKKEAAKE